MLDQMYLLDRLIYAPLTGVLTWRIRPLEDFSDGRAHRIWNTKFAGERAGGLDASTGYRRLSLAGERLYEHRVIWCMETGRWPERVDHENHRRADNRWVNLFETTHAGNNRNQKLSVRNTSGTVGVQFVSRLGAWRAEIYENGRTVYLGAFATKNEAVAVRRAAEAERGFHRNHGAVLCP